MGGDGGVGWGGEGGFEIVSLCPTPPARADDMPLGIM